MKIRVLFVCLGNICRSPLAEAIFNQQVKNLRLGHLLRADSAGTGDYHIGADPDQRSIDVALQNNIPINHKARQLKPIDGNAFDYILVMDENNLLNTQEVVRGNKSKVYKMRYFDPQAPNADVPDPYFGGEDGFQDVYDMLDRSMSSFLDFLQKEHELTA